MGGRPVSIGMKEHFAATLIILLIAGSAAQADFCDDSLTLGTRGVDISLTPPGTDVIPKCTHSLMLSGGAQVHCGWAFPYRDPAATTVFEHLVTTVTNCLGEAARMTADQDVNHPDFYDLRTFQLNGREIGVSLKDKAALSETYVFLRVAVPD